MKKFLPILLGADFKTYSIAKIISSDYNINPIILSNYSNELFNNTAYNIFTNEGIFYNDYFVKKINEIYHNYKNDFDKFIIFASNESYLNLIFNSLSKLDFTPILPYKKIQENLTNKDNLYKVLEELDFNYPETIKINKNDNLEYLPTGELFIRPLNIYEYEKLDFNEKDNSYHVKNINDAKSIIRKIFDAGYNDTILVQEYINGKDGNQFSINGYRAKNGNIVLSQARTILTDDLGNHIVQIDSNIEKINDDAKSIITKLDYFGLFNIDFKFNDRDGKIYITAINLRLGYSFYYSELNGIKLIKTAIEDLINNVSFNNDKVKKFGFNIFTDELTKNFITSGLFLEYKEENRSSNNMNPLYENINFERKKIVDDVLRIQFDKRIKSRIINKSQFE